VKTEFAFRRK